MKYLRKIPTEIKVLICGHERFWEFRTPFPLRDIRKNPRSMYARVPQVMAQFVLKREKLSDINGARLRSPSPIMALICM